jgi:peptidoglycan/xylan/chitin deacetylase (PgdA/CDA1 family)
MTRFLLLGLTLLLGGAVPRQERGRAVAITIDDLPAVAASADDWARVTERLLRTLDTYQVPAVGFVNERKLYVDGALDSARVALVSAWLRAGHELGNHTFAHRSANATPLNEFLDGVTRGETVTRTLSRRAGRPFRYFRHPQLHTGRTLAYRDAVNCFLAAHGFTVAPVTVDNQEWVYARAYMLAGQRGDSALSGRVVTAYLGHIDSAFTYSERISRALFGREIPLVLLLHANELNADHLGDVLGALRARGYRFVSLPDVLADSAYRSADTYVGPVGMSWLIRWAETRGVAVGAEPREEAWVSELASGR